MIFQKTLIFFSYWEESRVDPGSIVRNDIATESFWRQTDTEAVAESQSNQMAESTYRFRAFPFVGEMPAIERRCKAPLPLSGRLCPRMDRVCNNL
jgi:hypothetical protein